MKQKKYNSKINFNVSDDTKAKIEFIALYKNSNLSNIMRNIIDVYVRDFEKEIQILLNHKDDKQQKLN